MSPRAEFIALATLAGIVVAVLGYLLASSFVFEQPLGEALRMGARWSPTGGLAALGAAWIVTAWHGRRGRAGRRWRTPGLALRATLLALLLYPLAVACWVLSTGLLDQQFATAGMPLRELADWVPSIVFGATLAALLIGTLPAFAIAFMLGRRYLRRLAGSTTDIA
ncbi:hypothetical protein MNQ95_10940 [Pseudoxanthomonas daejeonensis]|uniref:hypothetical protein n=1 Tax=Pseudoxanthomonas daejeonensis TaxID=266062 RepID=UPI001F5439CA|nr:hypothetical protein [Pseudoxanthomonas daejeonensis]UNK56669.1 hypothetical protein MNQ95_10940 [Pseudoxanthomonas daejeonensis]